MKERASVYWTGLISLTTAVIGIGVPWNLASATDGITSSSASATVATPTAQAPALTFGVAEVVKMYQGGIGKDVLVGYIDSNVLPFHLDADGIIYLQHLGMPQEVTTALIRRDGELQKQTAAACQQQQASEARANTQVAAANTAPTVVIPSTPPPIVSPYPEVVPEVVYPDYTVYPYYGYPYYYGPNVVIAGGWGWGWGRGWCWGGRGGFEHGGFCHRGFGGHSGFGGRGGGRR